MAEPAKFVEDGRVGGALMRQANDGPLSYEPNNNPPPQYAVGFDGMSAKPFDEAIRKVLAEPVDPNDVETKPDGIVYLPGIFYRDRLTRAFGVGGWAIAARGPVKTRSQGGGELVIWPGALFCLGRFVSEAIGQCVYYPNNKGMTYADAVEGAKTDCITRCCKDLSIARELWDPGWRTEWQAKYAENRDGKWRRKSRESKLGASPASARSASSGSPSAAPATAPAAHAAAPAATAQTDSRPLGVDAPRSAALGRDDDSGEVIDGEAADEIVRLATKVLRWKGPFASKWLGERFGKGVPADLTAAQGETALQLLNALAGGGDDLYAKVLGQMVEEMRCAR